MKKSILSEKMKKQDLNMFVVNVNGKTVRAQRRNTINAKAIELVLLGVWMNHAVPKEHCVVHNN